MSRAGTKIWIAFLTTQNWLRISLLAVLALALALRLYHLGAQSLWLDEIGEALAAAQPLSGIFEGVRLHHAAAPLDYLIAALMVRIARSEWVLRLPSVVWSVLSVYWVFRLGRRLASPWVGVVAALLLAFSPLHLHHSQELRFYALFVFLSLVATEALFVAWERRTGQAWIVYAVVATLAVYTHPYTFLMLAFHAAWVGMNWLAAQRLAATHFPVSQTTTAILRFGLSLFAVVLLFIPWLWYALIQEHGNSFFTPPTLDWKLVQTLLVSFGGDSPIWWPAWLVLAALGLVSWFRRDVAGAVLLMLWVGASLPIIIFLNQRVNYFFSDRQMLFALPMYLLLVASGLLVLARGVQRLTVRLWRGRAAVMQVSVVSLAALGLVAASLRQVAGYYHESRDPFRQIEQTLAQNMGPSDMDVLFDIAPYAGFYSPFVVHHLWPSWNVQDLENAYESGHPIWVLLTPYLEQLPDAARIHAWMDQHPKAELQFGLQMSLYYLWRGQSQQDLWRAASEFQLSKQPELWESKGKILEQLGDEAAARQAYEHALTLAEVKPLKTNLLIEAGTAAYRQGDYQAAINFYDRALALEEDLTDAHVLKAGTLIALKQPALALDELTQVSTRWHRNDFWTHRYAADALRDLKRWPEALEQYQLALQLWPNAPDIRFEIALLYERMGQDSAAFTWLQGYLTHAPGGALLPAVIEQLRQLATNEPDRAGVGSLKFIPALYGSR